MPLNFYDVVGVEITNSFFYSSPHQQPIYFTPKSFCVFCDKHRYTVVKNKPQRTQRNATQKTQKNTTQGTQKNTTQRTRIRLHHCCC
jgi:hypothetical protein